MIVRMPRRRGIFTVVVVGGVSSVLAAILLVGSARAGSGRRELLQSKRGSEYVVAIARLRFRDPVRDARKDLLAGNHDLYCVGTYGCWPPGVEGTIPAQMSVHATAATGCVITGGALEMTYRGEEERYVAAYNQAKLIAFRGHVSAAVRPGR